MARVAWPLGRGGAGRCLRLWEWNGMEWCGARHALQKLHAKTRVFRRASGGHCKNLPAAAGTRNFQSSLNRTTRLFLRLRN
jgi:hypothetical protein